jgi:hypothetical protein
MQHPVYGFPRTLLLGSSVNKGRRGRRTEYTLDRPEFGPGDRMRRGALLFTTVTLVLALSAGMALAATFFGTNASDNLYGTKGSDVIFGGADGDIAVGKGGDAAVHGGGGGGSISAAANALKGGILATFEVSGERFRVWVRNPQTIWDLYRLKKGLSTASIPNGRILRGPGRAAHNLPYRWHLDPQDISMADFTTEVCDARPSYVEKHLGEFVDNVGRYCPWDARLVELRNYTGGKIKPPLMEQMR